MFPEGRWIFITGPQVGMLLVINPPHNPANPTGPLSGYFVDNEGTQGANILGFWQEATLQIQFQQQVHLLAHPGPLGLYPAGNYRGFLIPGNPPG